MKKPISHTLEQIAEIYGKDCQPLHKDGVYEPFQAVDGGYGYYGVIMENFIDDTIQCHICGGWFPHVGTHSVKGHKLYARQYREKYGFFQNTPLCHSSVSQIHSAVSLDQFAGLSSKERKMKMKKNTEVLVNYNKKLTHKEKSQRVKKTAAIVAFKNKHNTCDVQIQNRLNKVVDLLGKDHLSSGKVIKIDSGLYKVLCRRYGSWGDGLRHFKLVPLEYKRFSDKTLEKAIKKVVKKSPRITNEEWDKLDGVPSRHTIENRFNKPFQKVIEDFRGIRGIRGDGMDNLRKHWLRSSVYK